MRLFPRIAGSALGLMPLLLAGPALEAAEAPKKPDYDFRRPSDASGTGKFYFGREIAHIMGHQGAAWLERPERAREERPDLLLEAMELAPGQRVADIGAGSGYFTLPIAERVAPDGRVLAVDVQPEMLDLLSARVAEQGLDNVEPVLGTDLDPGLEPESVDRVLLVDVYHELSHPFEMMRAIARALKPDGLVFVVEYRGEDDWVPIKRLHKMTESQVRREMRPHPLTWVRTVDALPRQHVVVFAKAR